MTPTLRLATLVLLLAAHAPATRAQTTPGEPPQTPNSEPQTPNPEPPLPPPSLPPLSLPPLTLDDCVARALAQNFDISTQRLTTAAAADDIQIAKAAYDPSLTATATRAHDKTAPDAFTPAVKNDSTDTRLSVTQKITTGATLTATGLLDRNRRTPASTGLNPAYSGDLGITVRQPLLRGAGPAVNRAAIDRTTLGAERARLDLTATVLTVIRNVETAYYNLAFTREQREVRRFSLEVQQKLLEENKSRRASGVATDLEVLQSEVGVANASRDLLLSEQSVRNAEDTLLQLIGRFEFDRALGPVRLPDDTPPPVSFGHTYKLATENQPEYLSARLALDQFKLDIATTKNARLPQLDLGGSYGHAGRGDTYRNASRETTDGAGNNWQVDLSLTIPWGLRAENARHRQAKLTLERQQTLLSQLEQNILVQVRTAVRAVETNTENLRISTLATQLSQKQYEQEKARYEAGLSTFRFVQQSQADLDQARVNELQARVALRGSLADLARLEASSLARYRINLAP